MLKMITADILSELKKTNQMEVINLMHQRVSMDTLPQLVKLEMTEDLRIKQAYKECM